MPARLELSRSQILAFRRHTGGLDVRRPSGARSWRQAAWAGLQDSVPRAALLSLHARVTGVRPETWEHKSLVQLWGPRFHAYVVAEHDRALFSLGRLPEVARGRARAVETAARLHAALDGGRMPFGAAGRAMGVPPNSLRYAAATGTVLLRWDGARQPVVWTAPAPVIEPARARLELARRHLHVFGPTTAESFADWAGISRAGGRAAFAALGKALTPVRSPIGDGWILAADEPVMRRRAAAPAAARFLPSGDAFYLAWGRDRVLLVPDARQRAALWTTRVWPGALLVDGELAGTWRRAAADLTIAPWRRLSPGERAAIEAEASSLPLPGVSEALRVAWT